MTDCVVFVPSEVQRFTRYQVMQRIVVKSRNVRRLPQLVLKTITQLILNNIAMRLSQVGQHLELLTLGNQR